MVSSKVKYYLNYILFVSIFTSRLCAQHENNIFKITDSYSKERIQNAHINNTLNQIIAVTNDYGEFSLDTDLLHSDTLLITCIGYKTTSLRVRTLIENKLINLDPDTVILSEVTVHPIRPEEIIKKSITAIPVNYHDNKITITGNFDLTIRKDTTLLRFSKTKISVKLYASEYFPDISELSYISQLGKVEVIESDADLIKESFLFDHLVHTKGFLNINNLDSWKFTIEGYALYGEKELVVIAAEFISSGTVSHSGRIYINQEDFAILKIEYRYRWHKRNLKQSKIDSIRINNSGWSGFAFYEKKESKYELLNLGYTLEKETYYRDQPFHLQKLSNYEVNCNFSSK